MLFFKTLFLIGMGLLIAGIGAAIGESYADEATYELRENGYFTAYHEKYHCNRAWERGWDRPLCNVTYVHPDYWDEKGYRAFTWVSHNGSQGFVPTGGPNTSVQHATIGATTNTWVTRGMQAVGAVTFALLAVFARGVGTLAGGRR